MKVKITIDTSDNKETRVSITIDGKEDKMNITPDHRKAQVVLPAIESLLKKHNLNLADITDIEVNPGPGSFTGLRVGVAIANTLGYLLKIPVNGGKIGEFVEPIYS